MNISFVCVNFNSINYTLDFVKSVRSNSISAFIVVVDNSTSSSFYQNLCKELESDKYTKIVRQEINEGYFSALNFGLNFVDKNHMIVIGNNDLIFDASFISCLEKSAIIEDVAVICPNIITSTGRHQNPHVLQRMNSYELFRLDLYYSNYYIATIVNFFYNPLKKLINSFKAPVDIQSCYLHMGIGACYIVKPVFWKHYDSLEFPFFLYGEEAFLSNQVHKIGYKSFFDKNLLVQHAESGTLSLLPKRSTYEYAKRGYPTYRQYL